MRKGFTLIELIVVMAILAILVLFGVPKYKEYTKQAELTKLVVECKELEQASQKYYIRNNDWPRLNDTAYTAEEIVAFGEKILDKTGTIITLEETGSYYDIAYTKLSRYITDIEDKENYILQNPVGNVYAIEGVTEAAESRIIEDTVPTSPVSALSLSKLSAGLNFAIVLKEDGTAYGWGNSSYKQLEISGASTTPDILSITDVKEVAAGDGHTVFLKEDGTVWTIGLNTSGQTGIGIGTVTSISKVNIEGVKKIVATARTTFALKEDGTVYGWGGNINKSNSSVCYYTPVKINIENVVNICGGSGEDVFFIKEDHTLWYETNKDTVVQKDILNVKQVVSGQKFTVALKNDGTVWVWGNNEYGQLGTNDLLAKSVPTQIEIANVKKIVAGYKHTLFLKTDGTVWSTGYNQYGQLGLGDNTNKIELQQVSITDVADIDADGYFSVFIKNDGTVYTCGHNMQYQLGLGATQVNKNVPTQILNFTIQ